jgi:hypothetical protein
MDLSMPVTSMSQMWSVLRAYTLNGAGEERPVNHLNEWGGLSRRLEMPVFTAWRDLTKFDREHRTVTALICDTEWAGAVGVNNQERWIKHAEDHNQGVAAFFIIHAADEKASPRKVRYIDDDAVFVGRILREGTKTYIVGQRRAI